MKVSLLQFLLAIMVALNDAFPNGNTMEEIDNAASEMRVQCQNVDWRMLTPSEQSFAAWNMENSFNTVFNSDDDNKKKLQNVQLNLGLSKQMDSMIDVLIGLVWDDKHGYFTGSLVAGNADISSENLRPGEKDDMIMIALWEDEFEKLLHQGPYSALSRAKDCRIESKILATIGRSILSGAGSRRLQYRCRLCSYKDDDA